MLVLETLVDVTFAKLPMLEIYKLVDVTLVKVALPKLETPDTYKLVVVTPMPTMESPPIMVVETLALPSMMPPAVPPVPMEMVVVPVPVPRLMVDEVPMPSESVWATLELPTVIRPVPAEAPIVRAPAAEAGLMVVTTNWELVTLVAFK